ncbi:hypothetical protein B0A79_06880 [Flavobacterium piscis]|uniref:Uncharacterized protein n=1 Tax=Flavobacterium piscis TaxID=1114874 RepID=A0ABX2XP84_9FLAO|nr:hypothetical protein FLP_02940 [Flavobacterium piscis]OXG05944.1 hypothetical protein B0A79_06880 [Flavobacterium piscis]
MKSPDNVIIRGFFLEFGVEFFATDLWIIKILVASLSGLLSFVKVLNQECKQLFENPILQFVCAFLSFHK